MENIQAHIQENKSNAMACRTNVENMTLEDIYNTKPIRENTLTQQPMSLYNQWIP